MPLLAAFVVLLPAFSMANPEAAETGDKPKTGAPAKQEPAKPAPKPAAKPVADPAAKADAPPVEEMPNV